MKLFDLSSQWDRIESMATTLDEPCFARRFPDGRREILDQLAHLRRLGEPPDPATVETLEEARRHLAAMALSRFATYKLGAMVGQLGVVADDLKLADDGRSEGQTVAAKNRTLKTEANERHFGPRYRKLLAKWMLDRPDITRTAACQEVADYFRRENQGDRFHNQKRVLRLTKDSTE